LGKTGLKVSQLGFGAMRLPMAGEGAAARVDRELATAMMHAAFEGGVNYIDTAVGYCNSDSQSAVGEALKGWRDKIVVSTKNHDYGQDEKAWWDLLEESLRKLDVDSIDIYNHHGLNWKGWQENVEPRVGKWMQKAKDQGLIKHICNSFHDDNAALKRIVDTGYTSSITLQYNMLDRSLEEGIAYAHEKGVGVVVMGPVAGGLLGGDSQVLEELVPGIRRVPELALRFVLGNPNVSVALSGMSTIEQVRENLAVADAASLNESDAQAIRSHAERLKKMADLYCTGCGYCMPCPQQVKISAIFSRYNLGRVWGLWGAAKEWYQFIGKQNWDTGKPADACVECGQCVSKCPQKLPIIEQLKEAHKALTANGADASKKAGR
jgi:hypothetical protein